MMTMTITSIVLALAFVAFAAWVRGELPGSISALVYTLSRPWQWVWIVWMWAVAFTACIPLIEVMPSDLGKGLAFLTLVCLMFVGGMPVTEKENSRAHNLFGVSAGVVSQVCVLLLCPQWLWAWLAYVVCVLFVAFFPGNRLLSGKGVLMAEVICYITVIGSVLTAMAV